MLDDDLLDVQAADACSNGEGAPASVLVADRLSRLANKLSTMLAEYPKRIVGPLRDGCEPAARGNETDNFGVDRSTSRRRIELGDLVVAKQLRADEARVLYGDRAREPFVVEGIDKTRGQLAVRGAGMLFWSSDVGRLKTRHQVQRDALIAGVAQAVRRDELVVRNPTSRK